MDTEHRLPFPSKLWRQVTGLGIVGAFEFEFSRELFDGFQLLGQLEKCFVNFVLGWFVFEWRGGGMNAHQLLRNVMAGFFDLIDSAGGVHSAKWFKAICQRARANCAGLTNFCN